MRIVAYERVSTARQGASGLGMEAQRQAIEGYASAGGGRILARFTEVESGRCPDRPELAKALHLAKVTGATLVIAKLDRRRRVPAARPGRLWTEHRLMLSRRRRSRRRARGRRPRVGLRSLQR